MNTSELRPGPSLVEIMYAQQGADPATLARLAIQNTVDIEQGNSPNVTASEGEDNDRSKEDN